MQVFDLFGETLPRVEAREPSSDLSNDLKGRAGEFLACAALAELGVVAYHVPSPGFDVIAQVGTRLLRVQVKARSKVTVNGDGIIGGTYGFSTSVEDRKTQGRGKRTLSIDECDVVACVAMDLRRVLFLHISDISASSSAISRREFEMPDIERGSWTRVCSIAGIK